MVSRYLDEAVEANILMNQMADVINRSGSSHLAKLLAVAAVAGATIQCGVEDGAGSVGEIEDLFVAFLQQRLELSGQTTARH